MCSGNEAFRCLAKRENHLLYKESLIQVTQKTNHPHFR